MNQIGNESEISLELSKMFHEIKNPLTLINSSLQLIESEHPEVKDFRFWNQTIKDLQNLRILINDLSSFQKSNMLNMTKRLLRCLCPSQKDTATREREHQHLMVVNLL